MCPGVNRNVDAGIDPPGWGLGQGEETGNIREGLLELTSEPYRGSVSARREELGRWQPGRGNRHGEGGRGTRLLVLAKADGKEISDGFSACTVG